MGITLGSYLTKKDRCTKTVKWARIREVAI